MDKFIHGLRGRRPHAGRGDLIARHGKVVHVDAYGKADLASGRATRADDIFRMYSMTKPITSVALLMLYEEGRFQLTDPLSKFFPAFADVKVLTGMSPTGGMLLDSPRRPITIQDVFRHTAGFTYGFFGGRRSTRCIRTPTSSGRSRRPDGEAAKLPLLYQPGERWVYSVAHDVQAGAVEKLSGQKFDDYVQAAVFTPLGMTGLDVQDSGRQKSRRARALHHDEGKLVAGYHPLGGATTAIRCSAATASPRRGDYALSRRCFSTRGQFEQRAPAQPEDRRAHGDEPPVAGGARLGDPRPGHRLRPRRVRC
jgi:CubicO group peptidase (beta-lactamase class C family)